MITWIQLVLAVLATWRVTHLLAHEDGPADLIFRFRALLGHGMAGKLMDCFNCLSLWIAAPVALFVSHRPLQWAVSWLAVSGGACLIQRMQSNPVMIEPVQSAEGDVNHVLRSETFADAEQSSADSIADSAGDSAGDSAAEYATVRSRE